MDEGRLSENFDLIEGMHLHLAGIGGAGMSAIAEVLLDRNFVVSGSDLSDSAVVRTLRDRGAVVSIGHHADNITGAGVVVASSAIPANNPELAAARERGLPVLKRSDLLRHLMAGQVVIAVAGTHGKTTTTAMIAQILIDAGSDPSIIVGGELSTINGSGRSGNGPYFVVEADEYDHMFLGLRPETALITSIEHDHPDIYPTAADYLDAFCEFASLVPDHGKLVVSAQDPDVVEMLRTANPGGARVVTFGLDKDEGGTEPIDWKAVDYRSNQLGGSDFILLGGGSTIGLVRLRVPGLHNVRNALAAIAATFDLGLDFGRTCRSLAKFGGVGRRFQVLGDVGGVTVIDDYAHHPTEIQVTLAAARQRYGTRRLWAIWQPHTFSRTGMLLPQFLDSLREADRVIVLDVYHSRESDNQTFDNAAFIEAIAATDAVHIGVIDDAVEFLRERIRPDDVVLTLGAGDSNRVGQLLIEDLQQRMETFRR